MSKFWLIILFYLVNSLNIYANSFSIYDFYKEDKRLDYITDSVFNSLNNKQKAAQIIMYAVSPTDNVYTYNNSKKLLEDTIISNVIFLQGYISNIANQIQDYNAIQTSFNNIYACDCEPSLFNMKYFGSPNVLKTSQLNSDSLVLDAAKTISSVLDKIGIQINLSPLADNSFNTAVINNRSFGNNIDDIIHRAAQFIDESKTFNIATTIKHFPGHGNVIGDSHKNLVYINGPLKEVPTFYHLIQKSEPVFTMMGHIAIKDNEQFNTAGLPSSIDKNIVSNLLKNDLGFRGIVITDAMNMLGVSTIPNADFKALEAGNDIVLMPKNPRLLSEQIVEELDKQTALAYQIEDSVKKMIRLKICLTK